MKISALVLAVVLTFGANVLLACGGGSPVTMTVSTTATFDAAPAAYVAPSEGAGDAEVM